MDNQYAKIYNIFCLISEIWYTFSHRSALRDRDRLGRWSARDIAASGASAAWNIANFVLDGCGLSHAGANLQGFGNIGDGARPLNAFTTNSGSSGRPANGGVATKHSRRMPKETADQINDEGRKTDPRTNKRAKVANWEISEAASARYVETQPKRSCKFDAVFDSGRRDLKKRTQRDLDVSNNE